MVRTAPRRGPLGSPVADLFLVGGHPGLMLAGGGCSQLEVTVVLLGPNDHETANVVAESSDRSSLRAGVPRDHGAGVVTDHLRCGRPLLIEDVLAVQICVVRLDAGWRCAGGDHRLRELIVEDHELAVATRRLTREGNV